MTVSSHKQWMGFCFLMSFVTSHRDVNGLVMIRFSSRCFISCSRGGRLRRITAVISSGPTGPRLCVSGFHVWWRLVGQGLIKEARRWLAGSRWCGFAAGSVIQQSLRSNLHWSRRGKPPPRRPSAARPAFEKRLMFKKQTRIMRVTSVRSSQVRQTDTHRAIICVSHTFSPRGLAC